MKDLEQRMFRHCRALQEIQLPEGLRSIGESAFYGCSSLKKIQLPERLVLIGKMAFYRSGLREVRIPSGTEQVGSLAFAKSGLQKAWIQGGRETGRHYGADVFGGCARLKMLTLGEGVRHIPDRLAYGCAALERVVLPATLETVGRHAMEGTAFLDHWRQRVSAEGARPENILWDGRHLAGEVRIAERLQMIAGGAFYGNTRITAIELPPQVRSIGAAAFKGCSGLRRVWMPPDVTCLEEEVFSGCVALFTDVAGCVRSVWNRRRSLAGKRCPVALRSCHVQ